MGGGGSRYRGGIIPLLPVCCYSLVILQGHYNLRLIYQPAQTILQCADSNLCPQFAKFREIFKEDVMGRDLKNSMLILYNKINGTGEIPVFM